MRYLWLTPTQDLWKLEKKLDHESTKWYQLSLQVQSEYDGSKVVSAVDISIQVKDVNDNRPLFESNPYEAFVVENLPDGTSVIQVKATDLTQALMAMWFTISIPTRRQRT